MPVSPAPSSPPHPPAKAAAAPPPDPERVRPELNLERWSVWQPARSKSGPRARVLEREIPLPDGSRVHARVEVGFTQRGMLTTEDQKTYYALVKLWEENGRAQQEERVVFSLRHLARILKKQWGTNVIDALTQSLARLYATPFFWTHAYYDSHTGETQETLEGFRILDELKIIRAGKKGEPPHTGRAMAYFRFNHLILSNLRAGHTKPVLLDTVLRFESEIAQMLYTNIDLILADKSHYERRTRELFQDLGLEGVAYRNASNRRQRLLPALKELEGVPLSKGGEIAAATLERTKDGTDFKVVFHKKRGKTPPPAGTPAPPAAAAAAGTPPAVTPAAAAAMAAVPVAAKRLLADQAADLVRHFYALFQQAGQGAHLPARALDQATGLIARRGPERARFVVDYAHRDSERTRRPDGPGVRAFGWVLGYENQAAAAYDREHPAQAPGRGVQAVQAARRRHEEHFRGAYHAYLERWLSERLETEQPAALDDFHAFEATRRRNLSRGPGADTALSREYLARFDAPDERRERFRAFLRERAERRQRVPGVLAFWEWDRAENPHCFERQRSEHAADASENE